MSNARKSIKPASNGFHRIGHAINVTSCPATSSMTTCCGSFLPQPRASRVAARMPTAVTATISNRIMGTWAHGGSRKATSHQTSTAAKDPQVPGPGRSRPTPKKVATSVAHLGAGVDVSTTSIGLLDVLIGVVDIVGLWIVQRRGDNIRAAGPLAEVNQSASVAAKRKLGIAGDYDLLACGASQADNAFLRHHRT